MSRPEQQEIPGTEREKIPSVEKAARKFIAIRDERMALTEKETDAKAVLMHEMEEHNLTIYRFVDQIVEVKSKANVKVKTADEEGEEPDEDESDD